MGESAGAPGELERQANCHAHEHIDVLAQAEKTALQRPHVQEGKQDHLNSGRYQPHQAETKPPADRCMNVKKSSFALWSGPPWRSWSPGSYPGTV